MFVAIYYNPKLKKLAQELRKNGTLSEVILWQKLKGKKMMGYDFHRQKPLDNFIVDFFSPELGLILEIDGKSHDGKFDLDEVRQKKLEKMGFNVMRFSEGDVRGNLEGVLLAIEDWIRQESHTPRRFAPPLSRGD